MVRTTPYLIAVMLIAVFLLASGCTQPAHEKSQVPPAQTTVATAGPVVDPNQGLVDFVNSAVAYARTQGKTKAIEEFSNPRGTFVRGELYIYAYDLNGTTLAHPFNPEMIGVNRLAEKDAAGNMFIRDLRDAAMNGTGFVTFYYINPAHNRTIEKKLGYVAKIDDTWWLGSGIYLPQ
jgi:hypothetical protein